MKRLLIFTSLLISSAAFAVGSAHPGMDPSAQIRNEDVRYGTNSNDRYNNLDHRSNSMSSPSFYGAENNHLGEPEYYSRMTGGSSSPSTIEWQQQAGNPTTDWERSQSGAPGYYDTNRATGGTTEMNRYPPQNRYNRAAPPSDAAHMENLRNDVERAPATAPMEEHRATGGSTDHAADHAMDADHSAAPAATGTGTAAMTAQDTKRTEPATDLVQKIRSEITSQSDLSMNAHNVKIINQNGQIYLKGPVNNMTEKARVEELAKHVAGNTNVVNQTYVQKK